MTIPAFERWGLNPREQRVASIALYVLFAVVVLAIPVGLSSLVASRRADNEELKEALSAVNGSRAKIRERQERKTNIASRYAKKAPQIGGFLEQNASTAKVQISDSVDRPDVAHGKAYNERHTVIHLKNTGMAPIAKFLESLEKSEYPVSVTRLNIRKRSGEADSYGPVEIGVSAYESERPRVLEHVTGRVRQRSGEEVMEKWKERFKRFGPKLGYPIFYLLCLVVFLSWTFPYEKLRDRIVTTFNAQQRSASQPQELQIDDLDSSFLTGVKAKGVRLIAPSAEAGKAPSVISIDEARARISLLSLLVGTKDVSFALDAFDGTIKGNFEDSGKNRAIEVTFDGVDMARVDAIAANIGFPLDGKLFGTLKLEMPEGKASKANGTIALELKELNLGNQKELTIKMPTGPFTLPRLKVGTFTINGEAKDGALKLSKVVASGGDVDVNGDGKVQMKEVATDSYLDVNLKFKINDSYRGKNDKTKVLFGTPGGKDKPMLEMDPKMGRAKTPDGFYALRVAGTLARPDVQPGQGGASGGSLK